MELLLEPLATLLAEIAAPVIGAFVAVIAEGVAMMVELVVALLGMVTGRESKRGRAAAPSDASPGEEASAGPEPTAPPARPETVREAAVPAEPAPAEPPAADETPAPKRGIRWRRLAIIGAALLGTLWATDQLLLGFVADYATARLSEARGFTVEWDELDGHLLTGEVTLRGVRITRPEHPRSVVDLTIERLDADIALLSLLGSDPIAIERAAVHGLTGTLDRTGPRQPRPPSRGFVVEELALSAIDARVGDRTGDTPVSAQVRIERLDVRPFRRALTGFDLFFHADGDGSIDGRPFTARRTDAGAEVTFEDLPGELAGAWIGGPFAWLESARLDLEVRYDAPAGGRAHRFGFDMHLDTVRLAAPPDPSMRWRVATKPLRAWLDGRDPSLTLRFDSELLEHDLREYGRSAPRLFARTARVALTDALAEKAGISGKALRAITAAVRVMRR